MGASGRGLEAREIFSGNPRNRGGTVLTSQYQAVKTSVIEKAVREMAERDLDGKKRK
jgi:hypothetical protein